MIRLFEYQDADLFCHHSLDESPSPSEFYMHAHERMEILYFLSGDAQYLVEGSVYPLHPGELLIMNRAEAHKLQLLSAQPYERIRHAFFSVPCFAGSTQTDFCFASSQKSLSAGRTTMPRPNSPRFFRNLTRPGSPEHLRIHMLLILANVLYTLCSLSEAAASAADKPVSVSQQILQYVNLHLFEDISLSSVSRAFFLSASQLGRVFRQATGSSVGEYIRVKRLLAARERIVAGSTPTDAAPPAAFRTTLTFFRAYKAKFGCTPSH